MARTHLDRKNVALAGTIHRLRQAIDVYRVIGINVTEARRLGLSTAFFGYVQEVSLDMVALTVCKIFEYEKPRKPGKAKKPHQIVSIHGVTARLERHKYTAAQTKSIARFGLKYGNKDACVHPTPFLNDTITGFKLKHQETLRRLRDFRNQRVAHTQFGGTRNRFKRLPSLDEFEAVFDFSEDFYRLISDGILNIGPALIGRQSGMGLVRTLKALGVTEARFDFPPTKD